MQASPRTRLPFFDGRRAVVRCHTYSATHPKAFTIPLPAEEALTPRTLWGVAGIKPLCRHGAGTVFRASGLLIGPDPPVLATVLKHGGFTFQPACAELVEPTAERCSLLFDGHPFGCSSNATLQPSFRQPPCFLTRRHASLLSGDDPQLMDLLKIRDHAATNSVWPPANRSFSSAAPDRIRRQLVPVPGFPELIEAAKPD